MRGMMIQASEALLSSAPSLFKKTGYHVVSQSVFFCKPLEGRNAHFVHLRRWIRESRDSNDLYKKK